LSKFKTLTKLIETKAILFTPKIRLQLISATDDNMVLELADECIADFVITGSTTFVKNTWETDTKIGKYINFKKYIVILWKLFEMKAKYINPFTDFGFKKIFGEEASKPLLLDFLNAILPENDWIVSLSFKNNEQLGQTEFDRKAIYDIYCENEKGEKFIVELQKAKQNYRVIYIKNNYIYSKI